MNYFRSFLCLVLIAMGCQQSFSQTIDLQMTVVNASSASACDGEMDIQCTGCTPFVSYIWADTNSNIIGSGNHISGLCRSFAYCYQLYIVDYSCFNQIMYAPLGVATSSGTSFQLKTSLHYPDSAGANYVHIQQVTGGSAPYRYGLYNDYDFSPGIGASDSVIFYGINLPGISNINFDSLYDPYGAGDNYTLFARDTTGNFIGYYFSTFYDTITCTPSINHVWVNAQGYPVSDSSSCDGRAYAIGYGGTPPFTYQFSSGSTDSTQTGLCPGAYSVTVTDANTNQRSASFVVGYPGTYYTTDPGGYAYLDTLYANAEMSCGIDYAQPIDSFYVDTSYAVSPWQYVLQWVLVQDTNSFEFTETYWADTAGAYLFGFSVYCNQRSFGSYSFLYGLNVGGNVVTGTPVSSKSAGLTLYPNPSSGLYTIKSIENIKGYTIFDQSGRKISRRSGGRLQTIDLTGYAPGIYYSEIELNNGEKCMRKLIKN